MKFIVSWLVLFSLSQSLFAYTKGKTYKLTILHTNDHHGRFWPNKDGELGLAPRATLIKEIRDEAKKNGRHVLLLDAGDVNTGTPQSDMQNAEPDFKGMALLKYDVMAVGNHEFDKPLETLLKQREWGGFPFISANIYHKDTKKRLFPSHIKKEIDGLNITMFGLTTEDTPVKSNPRNTEKFDFVPVVKEAKSLVPKLRKEADILIGITHIGHYPDQSHGADAPGDVTLAREVDGIDLIVGGHTQKPLFKPDVQNGTIIVQAEEWGKYVGRVDLEFLDGELTLKDYKLIPINLKSGPRKIKPDPYVKNMLKPFKDKGDASLSVKLATVDAKLVGDRNVVRQRETNLGNLITRAYREKINADVALMNSGGIRASIPKGDVTYESVLTILPFGNELGMKTMTGKELKSYLEKIVFAMTPGTGGFPQMSGIKIVADKKAKKITSLKINDEEVVLDKKYTLAIPTFLAGGGDKYPKIKHRNTGHIDADILRSFFEKAKNVKAADFAPTGYLQYK